MYNRNNRKICCNCGKKGHIYKRCKEPVTSFGIIAFKFLPEFYTQLSFQWKYYKEQNERDGQLF